MPLLMGPLTVTLAEPLSSQFLVLVVLLVEVNPPSTRVLPAPLTINELLLAVWLFLAAVLAVRADDQTLADEVRLLRKQNALLQLQMQSQGGALESLTQKVKQLESAQSAREIAAGEKSSMLSNVISTLILPSPVNVLGT